MYINAIFKLRITFIRACWNKCNRYKQRQNAENSG